MRRIRVVVAIVGLFAIAGCGELEKGKIVAPAVTIDPQAAAQSLLAGTCTNDDVVRILAQSAEFQERIAMHLFLGRGKTVAEASELARQFVSEATDTTDAVAQKSALGACDQWVEHKTVVHDPCWAYTYTTFQSDRGTEYLFYFNPWWTVDANNIRWGANDPLVFWVLYVRNGGRIWGTHLCNKPYQLLIGNTAIALAGGAGNVLGHLYIHRT